MEKDTVKVINEKYGKPKRWRGFMYDNYFFLLIQRGIYQLSRNWFNNRHYKI